MRLSLRAWAPTIARARSCPTLLAAYARFLQRAVPLVGDEPKERLSEALAGFLAASQHPAGGSTVIG